MTRVGGRRVAGHSLLAEGAAFDDDGERISWNTTGGEGRAKCSCGALSEPLVSGIKRRDWHNEHKEGLRETIRAASRTRFSGPRH